MTKDYGAGDILEPTVDQFIEFMKFIADNNLWDRAKARLAEKGITDIPMGRRPIEEFRKFVADTLMQGEERRKAERVEAMGARCGCGGPPPQTPHTPPPPWHDPGPWR